MKRLLSLFLILPLLFSLTACGGGGTVKNTEDNSETDLSALDGEALYRYGTEKAKALKSARYRTLVLENEEETASLVTVRIRKGYDGFIWSRTGAGHISFDGESAYAETELGKYSAKTTARLFGEYLSEHVFAVSALDPDKLENVKREGDAVTFESKEESLLSLYASLLPALDSLSGKAEFSKEGIITKEVLTLTSGEKSVRLETVLDAMRSDDIQIEGPESTDGFVEVSDIGLPARIQGAAEALLKLPELQATLVASHSAVFGEKTYSFNRDTTLYQNKEGAYLSRQSLKNAPETEEESLFYQCLLSGGVKTENTYNVLLGEKLSEQTSSADSLPWQDAIREIIPSLSGFAALSLEEDADGYSIRFTLEEEYAKGFASKVSASFGELAFEVKDVAVGACTGNLSIRKADLLLKDLSYNVSGVLRSGEESGDFSARYSLLLDRTEGVTLPPLQTPTATVPGQLPDHIDHSNC